MEISEIKRIGHFANFDKWACLGWLLIDMLLHDNDREIMSEEDAICVGRKAARIAFKLVKQLNEVALRSSPSKGFSTEEISKDTMRLLNEIHVLKFPAAHAQNSAEAEAKQVTAQYRVFARRQEREARTGAAEMSIDPLFGEPDDADGIGNPERDPDAALLLYHQLNGHEIGWNASHPPAADAADAVLAAWRQRVIEDIEKYVAVTPEQQAELVQTVQQVVSATAPLLACASCGIRMASGYSRFDVLSLPNVFKLTQAQLLQREKLGTCNLLDVRGEQPHPRIQDLGNELFVSRTVDLREMVNCYRCEQSGELYHLHANLVDRVEERPTPDPDPDAPPAVIFRVWLCNSRCACVAKANGTGADPDAVPKCSLIIVLYVIYIY